LLGFGSVLVCNQALSEVTEICRIDESVTVQTQLLSVVQNKSVAIIYTFQGVLDI
jgi:hypothetical protein